MGEKHIEKIVKAYREFENFDGFSKVVEIEKIRENDYNLNVTLYVFPEEEVEEIDIAKEWEELLDIDTRLKEIENRIERYLAELKGKNKLQEVN